MSKFKFELIEKEVNNHEYDKAYLLLTNFLADNPNDIPACFYHAMIDFLYLREHFDLDYQELLVCISNKHSAFYNDAILLLIIVSDVTYHPDTILSYGDSAIEIAKTGKNTRFDCLMDLLYLVSYHYYDTNNHYYLTQAYDNLSYLFEKYENELEKKHYLLLILVLIKLNKFDEVLKALENFEREIGACGELYYAKGLYKINTSCDLSDCEQIQDLFNKALNYNFDELKINEAWCDYYFKYKQYTKIESLIKTFIKANPNNNNIKAWGHEFLLKTYLNDDYLNYFKALLIIERDLKSGFNKNLKFLKANLMVEKYLNISNQAKKIKRINQIIEYYVEAWNELKEEEIIYDLVIFLLHEHEFKTALFYLDRYYDSLINYGRKEYIKAGLLSYLNNDLEVINHYYELSYKTGYLNRLEYFDEIEYITKKPNKLNKELQKFYLNNNLNTYDAYSARKMGYRLLYGTFGFKKDYFKCKTFFEYQLNLEPYVSCSHTAMGRLLELSSTPHNNHYKDAFEEYQKAYQLFLTKKDECSCGAASLANAYLQGIGTSKDLDQAKKIILDTVKRLNIAPTNTVIYLYCYFALMKDERFSLNQAYELLLNDYPFERYEVVRYMYLKIVQLKIGIVDNTIDKKIKQCLKYANKDLKEYYLNNQDNELLYPFCGSF